MQPQYPTIRDKYIHAGTNQLERLTAALMPSYFKLDDRSLKDILAATHDYAQYLKFYNDQNIKQGDWTGFWEVEPLTFLAILSAIDTDAISTEFATLEQEVRTSNDPTAEGYLKAIVFLQKQAQKINHYYLTLPEGLPFKREIYHLIKKDDDTDSEQLATALRTLIAYHKEAYQAVYPEESLSHTSYNGQGEGDKSKDFFGSLWGIQDEDAFYAISASNEYRLDDWENLRQLAKTFQQAAIRIKHRANHWFDKNIETPQLRQPHIALYLVFLRLFEYARQEMNNLTSRHLEFFYEQILHLRRSKAVPDDVHLLFQLANNVDQYPVKQGTTLLAGKLKGKNLLFETIEDWVFNKAQVAEIKNTYLDLNSTLASSAQIYASPDVHKTYRNHLEAPNESSTAWRSIADDADLPFGEVGFAIASPQLILLEGKRAITFKITLEETISNTPPITNKDFKLYLSSEKEWIVPPPVDTNSIFGFQFELGSETETEFIFTILLEQDNAPVVQMSDEFAKKTGFVNNNWPLLKCVLNEQAANYLELYQSLRCISIQSLFIKVAVEGFREHLIVQNDLGVFDGTQKFMPFTSTPRVGSHFYLGSQEVFQKALTFLEVNLNWIAPPENFVEHYKRYVAVEELDATGSNINTVSKLFQPPFVNIDFIDRARVNLPEAVVRSGKSENGRSNIKITVLNVDGELISGATILPDNVETGSNGEYELEYDAENQHIQDVLKINYTDINLKKYSARYPLTVNSDGLRFETEEVSVNYPITAFRPLELKVVLFRAMQDRTPYIPPAVRTMAFFVKDVFGTSVTTGVSFFNNGSTSALTPLLSLPFTFNSDDINGLLKISSDAEPPLHESLEIALTQLTNYALFEVTLYPNPILTSVAGLFTIKDKNADNLSNSKISLKNPTNTLAIFSNTDGTYTLPTLTNFTPTSIEFVHPDHELFIYPIPTGGIPESLNIQLHLPKQITKFKGVRGRVLDSGIIPPSNNLTGVGVSIIGRNINPPITTNADGYNLIPSSGTPSFLYEDDTLLFEKNAASGIEYYSTRIVPFGDTNMDVVLFRKSIKIKGTENQVKINLKNIFGGGIGITNAEIDAITITPSNDAEIAIGTENTTIIITNLTNRATLSIDFGVTYLPFKISIEPNNNYEVFLAIDPKLPTTQTTTGARNNLTGTIFFSTLDGLQPLERVLIKSRWTEGDDEIPVISSTYSDENGNYTLHVPNLPVELEFSHPSYITEVVNEQENVLYNELNLRLSPLPTTLSLIRSKSFNQALTVSPLKIINSDGFASTDLVNGTIIISQERPVGIFFKEHQFLIQGESPPPIIISDVEVTDQFHFFYEAEDGRQFYTKTTCDGYPAIDLVFFPDRFQRVVQGVARDAYDENPAKEVPVRLMSGGTPVETYRITKTDAAGNYEMRIPGTVTVSQSTAALDGISNPFLRFLGRDFFALQLNVEDNSQPTTAQPIYSFIDVYLNYQKLNRLPLVTGDATIEKSFTVNINALNVKRDPRTQAFTRYTPTLKRGFVRITLEGSDFLHEEYPNVLTALSILAAGNNTFALPKPPYAPTTNGITINYESEQLIEIGANNDGYDQYYHLFSFNGYKNIHLERNKVELLYGFTPYDNLTTSDCPIAPANLYLGIKDLTPGSNLSLLFQAQAGTEQNFEDLPPKLQWSYLAKDNQWLPFSVDQILKDTTRGLTRTGVVQLQLPFDMVKENTLFNPNLHWIRIAAIESYNEQPKKTVHALPSLVDVRAQVLEGRFVLDANDEQHFIAEKPLVAGSIKRLEISDSNVKKIEQPFPTFNGRLPEMGDAFYKRASERLQHRDRAVTVRDYERLLLEKFTKVYRAKCLRHSDLLSELAPGHVLVAVIPDLRQWNLEMPIAPRFSRGDLNEMADYLRTKTNLFVARQTELDGPYLHVENAIYEPIEVELEVRFKAGEDEEYAKIQLNKAIEGFIAPWIYDPKQDIAFDRPLDRSRLIQFIETQEYVDAILKITIKHCGEAAEDPMIVPFTSRSVLTTTEKEHTITPKQK